MIRHGLRVALYSGVAGALAAGCASVTSRATAVGTQVVGAVRAQEPELFDIEHQLADSAGAYIGRAVQDAVLTKASATWDTMLLKVNSQSKQVVGNLAEGVERDLNRSIQVTLAENSELADSAGRQILNHLLDDARAGVDPLVDQTMSSVERGLRERLRPVLIEILGEAADSMSRRIRALDRQLAESETGKGIGRLLWGLVIGLGVVVVGGGFAWRRSSSRYQQALRVAAMQAPDSPAVAQVLRGQGLHAAADIFNDAAPLPGSPPGRPES